MDNSEEELVDKVADRRCACRVKCEGRLETLGLLGRERLLIDKKTGVTLLTNGVECASMKIFTRLIYCPGHWVLYLHSPPTDSRSIQLLHGVLGVSRVLHQDEGEA